MRVYSNNYRDHWLSPYGMIDHVFFWTDWSKYHRDRGTTLTLDEDCMYVDRPAWVEPLGEKLMPVSQAIQWVLDRVHPRIEYVKIDKWDTWSMDHTLARIVLPMLKQLHASKHGGPCTDDVDVPEHLRSTSAAIKENDWDTDSNHFQRWDWIMGEMIFAFECKNDDSWEEAFREGKIDWISVPVDAQGNTVDKKHAKWFHMEDGPGHTYKCDYEGMKLVQDRITNGFRLFGKYFEALWD